MLCSLLQAQQTYRLQVICNCGTPALNDTRFTPPATLQLVNMANQFHVQASAYLQATRFFKPSGRSAFLPNHSPAPSGPLTTCAL